jgi:hypothetical protein
VKETTDAPMRCNLSSFFHAVLRATESLNSAAAHCSPTIWPSQSWSSGDSCNCTTRAIAEKAAFNGATSGLNSRTGVRQVSALSRTKSSLNLVSFRRVVDAFA